MRSSLRDAIRTAGTEDGYPRGSIVLCAQCLVPLYELRRGIGPGEKANRTVDAYRPLTAADLDALALRDTTDAGVALRLRQWTRERKAAHAATIPELHTGSAAECPACRQSFVRVRALEASEVIDRAYVLELMTLPPYRPVSDRLARAWTQPETLPLAVEER